MPRFTACLPSREESSQEVPMRTWEVKELPGPWMSMPVQKEKHILIIGGGVIGLTTCRELMDRGYRCTVVSKEYADRPGQLTSQIAGALWEFPPAVCGKHTDEISLSRSKKWCMSSWHRFNAESQDPTMREEAGVRMRYANFFFKYKLETNPGQMAKMEEIANSGVSGFRRDPALIDEVGANRDYGVVDAYRHSAPIIDTDRYMVWLRSHVVSRGAKLCEGTIDGDLLENEEALLKQFGAHAIVNCTGLNGGTLCDDDSCYPLRGALVRLVNDGSRFPQLHQALSISLDGREDTDESDLVFIVPRNDNTLIIGGIAQANEWDTELTFDNFPKFKQMLNWNAEFYPPLKNAEIDPVTPVAAGLRPFRKTNVRCERDARVNAQGKQPRVFHSYGQGGAGWSLSFGCAGDICDYVDNLMREDFGASPMVPTMRTMAEVPMPSAAYQVKALPGPCAAMPWRPLQKHVLIIGGGVTGLTTARSLMDRGYRCTVVSTEFADKPGQLTSQIAGALWEFPPAVCGKHTDEISLARSKQWCMNAYHRFNAEAQDPTMREEAGVRMRFANFFFKYKLETNPGQMAKMEEIASSGVDGFLRDATIIDSIGANRDYGVVDAYRHSAPIIDTDRYMVWLRSHVVSRGCRLMEGTITGDLLENENALLSQFNAHAIVNCTGLNGGSLCDDDSCYPLRGALVRLVNDGSRFPQLHEALSISLDGREDTDENDLVFIVPRNDNTLIIGGIAQANEWDTELNLDNFPKFKQMLDWNAEFYPPLKNAEIDPVTPVAVGLRPFRKTNVRCERDARVNADGKQPKIFHSYGQGGAGWSLSFGCADDICDYIDASMAEDTGVVPEIGAVNAAIKSMKTEADNASTDCSDVEEERLAPAPIAAC